MAAAAVSGIAWTRSVPTRPDAAIAGYKNSSRTIISDPDPTDVSPTIRPPATPTSTVGHGRTVSSVAGMPSPARR